MSKMLVNGPFSSLSVRIASTGPSPIFFNADDPIQRSKIEPVIKKYGYSKNNSQYYNIKLVDADPFVKLEVEDITITSQLIGRYNFSNCCAAVLIGKYFNLDLKEIKQGIENYIPQNNRSQIIKKNGHHIILDAYNANPTSMKAALENFKEISGDYKIVFLGDMFELGCLAEKEHQYISDLAIAMNFSEINLIGENFFTTKNNLRKFKSFDELKETLQDTPISQSATILIKGSRGMALERILDLL